MNTSGTTGWIAAASDAQAAPLDAPLGSPRALRPQPRPRRRTLRSMLKDGLFLAYRYGGYVAARDAVLALLGRSRAVVLTYHRVGGDDALSKPRESFRADLRYLKRNYECITLAELCDRLRRNVPLRRRCAVVTFDDGYRDNFTEAFPELVAAGVPATFFVSTGFVGTDRVFPHDARAAAAGRAAGIDHPKITWDDLRQMQAAGMEIGSHTVEHTDMGSADEATAKAEAERSLEALNRELGNRPRAFAFPWGKPKNISEVALAALRAAGYYAAAFAYGGTNGRGRDTFRIRRIDVGNGAFTPLATRARVAGFDPGFLKLKLRDRSLLLAMVLGFTCCFTAAAAQAKEIVVAPTGDDEAAGTVEKPLATPVRALDMAAEGDTITLRGGEYRVARFLWVAKPGLTIRSADGERAAVVAGTEENDPQSVFVVVADRVTLLNLDVRGGAYYGIKVDVENDRPTTGVSIRGCRVRDTGRDCIKTFNADQLLIEDCEVGPSGKRDPSNAEGIDSMSSKGVIIRRCHVHDTATNAIYLKGGARDGVVECNRVENTGGFAGILLGQDSDEQWMRDGAKHEAIDCVARNNLVVNTGAAGIGTYSGSNVRFEHNTLVDVARQSQAAVWIVTNGRGEPARQVSLRNNVIAMNSARPFIMARELADELRSDFNVFHNGSGGGGGEGGGGTFWRESRQGGGTFKSFSFDQWQKKIGADRHSKLADPLLDRDNGHRCRPGSPAIDAGEPLAEVKADIAGVARPQGAGHDIGAYEHVAREVR